jgi:hypothetical protein
MLSPQLQRNHQEAAFNRVQIAADAADRIEGSFLVGGELILGGATRSDPALCGDEFLGPSWSTWRIIARLYDSDAALLSRCKAW